MHVGVPTGGQGHAKMKGQRRAEGAHLTGARDVDQVRLETLERTFNDGNMAQEGGIEAEVLLQREGKKAPRQLKRLHIAVSRKRLFTIAGAHAKEGQVAPPRKGLEMTAGVGYPVDLVERVREVGHTRRACNH